MSDKTKISWTDATWNPIRARNAAGKQGWYCEKVTAACDSCYAETQNMRPGASGGTGLAYKPGHRKNAAIYLDQKTLLHPLRWRRGRRIFPLSMSDLFGSWVPDDWIDEIFAVMARAQQHTFQVLTKRPSRMRKYLSAPDIEDRINEAAHRIPGSLDDSWFYPAKWPLPNVWLGTSICDQENAEDFVPELLGAPATLHFVSAAPLLGNIDLTYMRHSGDLGEGEAWLNALGGYTFDGQGGSTPIGANIGWVLTEGESGRFARPSYPSWFRRMRDDCASADIPFHHKQNGEYLPPAAYADRDHMLAPLDFLRVGLKKAGRELDGVTHDAFPALA